MIMINQLIDYRYSKYIYVGNFISERDEAELLRIVSTLFILYVKSKKYWIHTKVKL